MNIRTKLIRILPALTLLAVLIAPNGNLTSVSANVDNFNGADDSSPVGASGIFNFAKVGPGTRLTECPQAGLQNKRPQPLDQRQIDQVEQISNKSRNIRVNQDYSCLPQNETSIAVNPAHHQNVLGGANDYRIGGIDASGFYASTDGGKSFYDGLLPVPTNPGASLTGGGDPAIAFDRAGIAYYAQINFDDSQTQTGVFVSRSTNGGFTWNRPCVPRSGVRGQSITDANAVCGGLTDPRQPGDGVVQYDTSGPSGLFNDKEYITAGPRPAGQTPTCYAPVSHTPGTCNPIVVGVDRLYVTWSRFVSHTSRIFESHSDDQGRSWSQSKPISATASFCQFAPTGPKNCDNNQDSVPTVNPTTGELFVAFLNGNTPNEDQYLLVRSTDGGTTFQGPFFISPIFDINYPYANVNRPDCTPRGAQTRSVLTNSCFRVGPAGNIVADRRGGKFANNLYMVFSDNRNGTTNSSNTDIWFFRSTDAGTTWIGPTRVNNDRSVPPPNRNCGNGPFTDGTACQSNGNYGNDQWFPWVDITDTGLLHVGFFDRRLDTSSTASEWPASRQRPGNYLTWFFGATCRVTDSGAPTSSAARQCVAPEATVIGTPTDPCGTDPPGNTCTNPGPGTPPGANQSTFPFHNFAVSDVPFNLDYAFRGGVFVGDYNNVAAIHSANTSNGKSGGDHSAVKPADKNGGDQNGDGSNDSAYYFWADSRNGRGSGGPNTFQPGRNPACEQSDVFMQLTSGSQSEDVSHAAESNQNAFLVTPCPTGAVDPAQEDNGDHGNGNGNHHG